MTHRERLLKVFRFEKVGMLPNYDFGYWGETIERWHKEGLPEDVRTNQDVERYLGLEGYELIPSLPINIGLYPYFEEKVLEDKGDHLIVQDGAGVIYEKHKTSASIPKYLKFPIETRSDWERFRDEHLDPDYPGRIDPDIRQKAELWRKEGWPIKVNGGSLYGWLRDWMGVENVSIAIMTEKAWVEEMMEHLTNLTLLVLERIPEGTPVDYAHWWEDMCFNHGPLISPKLFEELMVPRYKRITDFLRERFGITVSVLDCDGQIYQLVPGWLRGGINCMFPIEAAHTDPLVLRERHGHQVLLIGGVDKRALIAGKEAIDRELERLIPLVEDGGYIPTVDHRVPPDVSFENYCYYLEKKQDILKLG